MSCHCRPQSPSNLAKFSAYQKNMGTRIHSGIDIHQHGHWDLYDYNPSSPDFSNSSKDKTLPSWITNSCNVTIFLPTMDQPKHGQLIQTRDKWLFRSGKVSSTKFIELLDFHAVARDMIKHFTLFQGNRKFKDVLHLRSIIHLKSAVANYVSVKGLTSLIAPSSVQAYSKMSEMYRKIWNKAYLEELHGLQSNNI